jgi:hypothetical protein
MAGMIINAALLMVTTAVCSPAPVAGGDEKYCPTGWRPCGLGSNAEFMSRVLDPTSVNG